MSPQSIDEDNKYEGLASFTWLISFIMGIGVGIIKQNVGWGLVAGALSLIAVAAGFTVVLYYSEKQKHDAS